jgi:hypothetical protein
MIYFVFQMLTSHSLHVGLIFVDDIRLMTVMLNLFHILDDTYLMISFSFMDSVDVGPKFRDAIGLIHYLYYSCLLVHNI